MRCSDGTVYPVTFLNWYWAVLDLMIERSWCEPCELTDEAQMIFLEKRDQVELTFQDTLWAVIRADYDEFERVVDGHVNQNMEPNAPRAMFPPYLSRQVTLPYGLSSQLQFKAANFS